MLGGTVGYEVWGTVGPSLGKYLYLNSTFQAKLNSGLSMKKKGVSNLVAKWQNIQDESSKQRPQ